MFVLMVITGGKISSRESSFEKEPSRFWRTVSQRGAEIYVLKNLLSRWSRWVPKNGLQYAS
jgi:hypothetical protein